MRNKNNWMVPFPCLRCGKSTVLVFPLFLLAGETSSTFRCRLCGTHHYLSLTKIVDGFSACYCRYTRRYALDGYDVDAFPTIIRIDNGRDSKGDSDNEVFSGPINIYPRKRRFSCSEVKNIWQATSGRCHICGHLWRLDQRGMSGWHIDHVMPHIGFKKVMGDHGVE